MHINKVINTYFAFVMAVSGVAFLSYSSSVNMHFKNSYASVINVMDAWSEDGNMGIEIKNNKINTSTEAEKKLVFVKNDIENFVNFEIVDGIGFAQAGNEKVKIMGLNVDSEDRVVLDRLRLRLEGKGVVASYLYDGDKMIAKGKYNKTDDKMYLNFSVRPNAIKNTLWVVLDFSKAVTPGDRFSLNIENAEDLELRVAGKTYSVPGYYPIKGKHLSIVGDLE